VEPIRTTWNTPPRLFTGGTVATALAAIAAVNLPIALLRQPWHLVSEGADIVHHAQVPHPDDYSTFGRAAEGSARRFRPVQGAAPAHHAQAKNPDAGRAKKRH